MTGAFRAEGSALNKPAGRHPSGRPLSRVTRLEAVVAFICLMLAVAPFVVPAIPVGTDLPKHVFVAQVLSHYSDPQLKYAQHFGLVLRPGRRCLWNLRSPA